VLELLHLQLSLLALAKGPVERHLASRACRGGWVRTALQPLRRVVPRDDVLRERTILEFASTPQRALRGGVRHRLRHDLRLGGRNRSDDAGVLSSETQKFATYAVLCAALLVDAYSVKTKRWCPVTLRRQTPKAILQQHGARRAALAWTLGSSSRRSVSARSVGRCLRWVSLNRSLVGGDRLLSRVSRSALSWPVDQWTLVGQHWNDATGGDARPVLFRGEGRVCVTTLEIVTVHAGAWLV